ncbi:sigma 54-interacting transcriptional regulator [Pseudobacteriovorax antillogorgiicola]|uniref:Two-component system, NtrC family, response regulator GlrR n=1 Tax=Pseudobacteriovorax antillogorgiicola TaxID=1513793 RepID=A0A1Y6C121_9BACT|nr:sigma 54-interacting transcriptional regulator [Pseudobacteriovorax antillogorgiicola]TCS51272.1 two-component system response regulator GlrR [Pseudobacteriovorax antillogorgiicola]SMF36349.1 two-component system, NtrC family, response regulator GlrR [Pseudobacteriovorax antillogorgiicola]
MTQHGKILLVDDDEGLLKLLKMRLVSEGFVVETATDGVQCLQRLDIFEPDVLISDLRMDKIDGMTLFEEVSSRRPFLPVIIITAHGTIPEAVEATQKGVFSFITKPIDKDKLFKVIQKALTQSGKQPDQQKNAWCADIITQSQVMLDLLKKAKLVAQSDSNILLQGESGTGKELLARAIHNASRRKFGPFIAINCAALPGDLLEAELFGTTKNAGNDQKSLFQAAKGGTLFLDEVSEMPLGLQAKLLRVLEERQMRAGGSLSAAAADIRIMSATHQDLEEKVQAGEFREDLFYKLNVIGLSIPTLNQRREDISLLAKSFLQKVASRHKPRVKSFAPKALELICNAQWPGNVRQLYNVVERLVVLSTTSVISESSVREALTPDTEELQSLADAKSEFERQYLIQVLRQAKGNVSQAARAAKRNRTDFYKLMARHNLQPAQFKAQG